MAQRYLDADIVEAKALGVAKRKYKKIAEKEGREFDFSDIPPEIIEPYATQDPIYTQKLWFLFREPIKKFQQIYDFEKSITPIILDMQKRGMMVDRPFAKRQSVQYGKDMDACFKRIQSMLRREGIKLPEFKPNSGKQVAYILDRMRVSVTEYTKTGQISTDQKVLKLYAEEYPIIQEILMYRFIKKQKGTYFDPLIGRYTTHGDPFAHFFLFQSGARTGRTSAELIQTIPRAEESETAHAPKLARKAFRPRPGYTFVAIDYKALQMVLFYHFSNAEALIKRVWDGWDPHDATSEMIFGKITKPLRRIAKTMGLGMIFMMGKDKLIRSLKVSPIEGSNIYNDFCRLVPVREFCRDTISTLYRRGVLNLDIESDRMSVHREYRVPQELAYKGPNTLIQGTEAYIVKWAMKRSNDMIRKSGIDANILMNVHDELLFEVSNKEPLKKVVKKLQDEMEDYETFKVPLRTDVKVSNKSWGDAIPFN